jgi:hypothetical protein
MMHEADYFNNYSGTGNSYLNAPHWVPAFGNIAAKLKERFPKTWSALDAGCAIGYLVEAFRHCGVAAWGIDSSEYAIANARPGAKEYVKRQSLTDPVDGHYDLLTCIEVLEHIPARDAGNAIGTLCAASDNIIFTSTPLDFVDVTHVNVRPADYWVSAFAEQGFVRDPSFDGSYIVEWCMRFVKA